jgi:hypothetical protein
LRWLRSKFHDPGSHGVKPNSASAEAEKGAKHHHFDIYIKRMKNRGESERKQLNIGGLSPLENGKYLGKEEPMTAQRMVNRDSNASLKREAFIQKSL